VGRFCELESPQVVASRFRAVLQLEVGRAAHGIADGRKLLGPGGKILFAQIG
jgi:hypothetical protein